MKKINFITVSIFWAIFLIGFIVSYKNSGNIRKSIRIVIIWAIVTLSPISVEAKSSGLTAADGFTSSSHSRLANKHLVLFNQTKPKNTNFSNEKLELDYLVFNLPRFRTQMLKVAKTFHKYGFNSKTYNVNTEKYSKILYEKTFTH